MYDDFQSSFRLMDASNPRDQLETVVNPEIFRRYVKCRIAWILKIISEFCLGKFVKHIASNVSDTP